MKVSPNGLMPSVVGRWAIAAIAIGIGLTTTGCGITQNDNRPPGITGSPDESVLSNSPYSFTPEASDPDGDVLSFTVINKPSWADFSLVDGTISGTPTRGDIGAYGNINVCVDDGFVESPVCMGAFAIDVLHDDTTPPEVESSVPSHGDTDVARNTSILITFSEAMDTTATEAVFFLEESPNNAIVAGAMDWSASGATLTFKPERNLKKNREYLVTVGAEAADLVGLTLGSAYTLTFETGTHGDDTPPGEITDVLTTTSDGQVQISWSNPEDDDLTGVLILRRDDGAFPIDREDPNAVEVYDGVGPTFTDTGLTNGATYHYTAWAHDAVPLYSDSVQFQVTLPAVASNHAPECTDSPENAQEGVEYSYTLDCTDPDEGDTLTFTDTGETPLPDWMTLDEETGELSGTPVEDGSDNGTTTGHQVTVSDGELEATLAFSLTVEAVNDDPEISGTPPSATAGESYSFTFTSTDEEGDTLTFTETGETPFPEWVTLDEETGELSGTPGESDVGTTTGHQVTVTDDGEGNLTDTVDFNLTVLAEGTATGGTWVSRASMPTARSYPAVESVNGIVYVIGGHTTSSVTNVVESYNPTTNTWSIDHASMPTARGNLMSAVVNGTIYVIGGISGGSHLTTVEAYNPITNTWIARANMSTSRILASAFVDRGLIYVVGGWAFSDRTTVEVYDPIANEWNTLESLDDGRHGALGIHAGTSNLVIGGTSNSVELANTDSFNPLTNIWTELSPLPSPRSHVTGSGNLVSGNVYVFGGFDSSGETTTSVFSYNTGSQSWSNDSDFQKMPTTRIGMRSAEVNGRIYLIGGDESQGVRVNTVEEFTPPALQPENTWESKADMPKARGVFTSSVVNGKLHVIGGTNFSGGYHSDIEAYNPATDSWSTQESMPTARSGLASSVVNGIVYAIGGLGSGGFRTTVEAYDPSDDSWETKTSMDTARYGLTSSEVNGIIYAIGGYNPSILATVEAYDPQTDEWTTKSPMPTARRLLTSSVVDGIIYVIGGNDGPNPLTTVEAYNPADDSWTTRAPMPTAREHITSSVVNGIIYVFGGQQFTDYLTTVEAYNPATNTWTTHADLEVGRCCLTSGTIGGRVYLAGGYFGDDPLAITEAYTPPGVQPSPTWQESTASAQWSERHGHASVVFDDKIWVTGGWKDSAMNDVWDSENGASWSEANSNAPWTARIVHTALVFDDKIWIIGGSTGGGVLNDVWYSSDGVSWTQATSDAGWSPRFGHTSVVFDDSMWVIGGHGAGAGAELDDVWYSTDGESWTEATGDAEWPKRYHHTSVVFDDKIWIIGGYDSSLRKNDVWYSSDGVTWTEATDGAEWTARRNHTSVVHNGRMWVIGGGDGSAPYNNDVWSSVDGATWSLVTEESPWSSREAHSSVEFGGRIWVLGGYDLSDLNDVWSY